MPVSPSVREIFTRFENLNLLVLIEDLRSGRAARHAWLAGTLLCPVAHGLAGGRQVQELVVMGQAASLSEGCDRAALRLGADPDAVLRFVSSWDDEFLSRDALLRQLVELWEERREDAVAMQGFLQATPSQRRCLADIQSST
jgi:hypothetical protein